MASLFGVFGPRPCSFVDIVCRAMALFKDDPTMVIALETSKMLAKPFECLLCLWPNPCKSYPRNVSLGMTCAD